jgi:hypothetical protein
VTESYTDDQLAAVKEQMTPPPVATGAGDVASQVAGGSSYETDTAALMATIQAMQGRLDALEKERREQNFPALVSTVQALRDLLDAHADTSGKTVPDTLLRLADDAVGASKEAVQSGDVSFVREIAAKIERALAKIHPGGGDHPFYRQAVDFARDHIPEAADQVTGPAPSSAPALGSDQAPAKVIEGSRVA